MADTKTTYITLENLTRYNNNIKTTYETIANVALKADDDKVVHLDGAETIAGVKTFAETIVGNISGNAAKATADAAGNVIVDTYATKEEVSKIITAEIVVISSVSELPAQPTEKEKKTIYLVPNGSSETSNVYDEYVWASTKWEKIGTTQVDLSNYVTLDGTQTITGVKTFAETIVGSVDGNAGTADKLKTAVNINGTSFDGSENITTDLWGAARNVTVADADATNTGTSVSVDGSVDVTLKLPATIKAALNGNADTATLAETATKAVQDSKGNVIAETYLKAASIGGATDEEIDALFN